MKYGTEAGEEELKKLCRITDQKRETPLFWHVAPYDKLTTVGVLGGSRWGAKSSSHCLSVYASVGWLQVEHSLPFLLSK